MNRHGLQLKHGIIIGVIQMTRTPAFRAASGEISQLSCGIPWRHGPNLVGPPRNSESIPSSVMTLSTNMAVPVKRFIFYVFVARAGNRSEFPGSIRFRFIRSRSDSIHDSIRFDIDLFTDIMQINTVP